MTIFASLRLYANFALDVVALLLERPTRRNNVSRALNRRGAYRRFD